MKICQVGSNSVLAVATAAVEGGFMQPERPTTRHRVYIVFPAPFAPSTAMICPGSIASNTLSSQEQRLSARA
jgi:hypothetical protein